MKKTTTLVSMLLFALGVALACFFFVTHEENQWTSDSAEAIAELEAGLEAKKRYYGIDAIEHFEKAVEIDPDFLAARLFLLQDLRFEKNDHWQELFDSLRAADLEGLSPRERFLIRFGIAHLEGEREEAESILEAFLAEHPEDSFAREIRCDLLWRGEDTDRAEICYRELLEAEPNRTQAANRLGYLAMSQGRFEEAEEYFRTYRYIAPDQANPHDSLGELLILLGRYDEAVSELEAALAIRSDFCPSYAKLADLALYTDQVSPLLESMEVVAENCGDDFSREIECALRFSDAFNAQRWGELTGSASKSCVRRNPGLLWIVHRAAVLSGETQLAKKIEKAVAGLERKLALATPWHLKGVRLLAEGELDGALESFRGADDRLTFREQGVGMLKLFNRLHWAEAEKRAGNLEKAKELLASVEAINPRLAEEHAKGHFAIPAD